VFSKPAEQNAANGSNSNQGTNNNRLKKIFAVASA
jgi:hypothetical protein